MLRQVKITFSNGDIINTNMAEHLTDNEILAYYKVGRFFNLGRVIDNMVKVVKVEIIKEA